VIGCAHSYSDDARFLTCLNGRGDLAFSVRGPSPTLIRMAALPAIVPSIAPGLPVELKLLDAEPGAFSMFVWKNVTILSWMAPATGAGTKRVAECTKQVASACRDGFSNIHLVKDGIGLPTVEARHEFADMMNRHSQELACVGIALLGSGFWASALQGAITGIRMLNPRRSAVLRIHDSIDGVADWLPREHIKYTGVLLRSTELHSAMTQAFAETLQQAESGTHPLAANDSGFRR
jgi:hypothetical protein